MLKSKVGYSMNEDSFQSGVATAKNASLGKETKLGLLFTSCKYDLKELVKGVKSITDSPIIGCTSSGGLIVPEGIVTSENGFSGMMSIADKDMKVGVACHEAGKNARQIGRKVALEAVANAGTDMAPSHFYMVASPKEEEEYLMGIQDVIGRVPFFGGSAADDTVEGNWKIICEDKVFSDGVAVAFFYTQNEILTEYTGAYRETKNVGLITEVKDDRTLVKIDGVSALQKYAEWIGVTPQSLKGQSLLAASITKPLGVKDPLGNLTVIRHPMFGNDMGTKTTSDDTITLGNKAVEGTAIIQLESTVDELVDSTGDTLKKLRKDLTNDVSEPAAYLLIHCGGRKLGIGDRLNEVHKQLVKEAKDIPFICVFTFGEYGYSNHSANACGGLMLSFTGFSKE